MGIIDFLFDHLAAVIAVLVVLSSIVGSINKKKRAAQEEAETEREAGSPRRKSFREMMAEMEAELNKEEGEGETPEHPYAPSEAHQQKPQGTPSPAKESPWAAATPDAPKPRVSPWNSSEEGTSYEGTSPSPEGLSSEQQAPPLEGIPSFEGVGNEGAVSGGIYGENSTANGIYLPSEGGELTAAPTAVATAAVTAAPGNGFANLNQLDLSDLAKAVVMAEIIGKPKALR